MANEPNNETKTRESDILIVRFVEHPPIIFWWPIWLVGYILALRSWYFGDRILFDDALEAANWNTQINLVYIVLVMLVIFFTNVKTELQATLLIFFGVISLLFAILYFDITGVLLNVIPEFRLFMNANFFFWFSTGVFIIWCAIILGIDQRRYWFMTAGSVGYEQTHPYKRKVDTLENAHVEHSRDDIPCHYILGFGQIGDVTLRVGPTAEEHLVKNVAWVRRKQKLADGFLAAVPR